MEEPKKVIRSQYVGVVQVTKPTGMEVLNAAIEVVSEENPRPWRSVSVAVAPSTITITSTVSPIVVFNSNLHNLKKVSLETYIEEIF